MVGNYLSTSPPVYPSPSKERGRIFIKRGEAPLKLPSLKLEVLASNLSLW